MRNEASSRAIHRVEQSLGGGVGSFLVDPLSGPDDSTEHDHTHRLRDDFDAFDPFQLAREPLGILDVIPDSSRQAIDPIVAEDEPQLERAKPASELDPVIHVVGHVLLGRLQILGNQREGLTKHLRLWRVQHAAVDRSEEPLVWIEHERVDAFDPVPDPAVIVEQSDRSAVGCVGVDPHPMLPGNLDHGRKRIDRGRRGRAESRDHSDRKDPVGDVPLDRHAQESGVEPELVVAPDPRDSLKTETECDRRLVD